MTSLEKASLDETKTCGIRTRLWNAVSSLYNLFTFSFVNPLLKKGSANQLDEHSAVTVNPLTESIEELTNKFYQIFNKLEEDANGTKKTYLMNPVLYSLIKQHACLLCTQFVLSALLVCSRLLSPLTIRWFLIWLDDYKDGEADKHNGWFWGILLISSTILTTMIHNQGFWVSFIVGWKSKMSMIAAVHAKLLTLNTSSVAKVTIGHVVNLSSNDAERFSEASIFWPFLLLGPLETIMILILLSFVLGFLPAAAGLSFTLVLIPLQSMLSQQIAKLRRKTTKITDRRINFMSEMISGSLAVKMLGWEDPLLEEVDGIRKQEHRMLKKMNYIKANSLSITGHIQTIMACATFVVYRFTGNEFNIPDVLFAISLFSLPRMSLAFMFTMAVQTLSELLVSTRRLSDFFRLPEVNQIAIVKNEALQRGEVVIQNGHYGWYSVKNNDTKMQKSTKILKKISNKVLGKKNKESQLEAPELIPTLRNICLHVKPGELVGIVGKVGSGKSSLLYALLNDMENLNPHHIVQMTGSVSYCAQVPSIIAATVRENIVFGNEFNEDIYNQVISSCALDVDLEKFPFGDQTEIGERGINLSGGQKARIALARAAYCKADVNLLDDPLSAVDPKVGRILFERCIDGSDGIMKNSTRLLVTHQKQFLPHCDRIILMNNGEIECIGTWSQLSEHCLLEVMKKETSSDEVYVKQSPSSQIRAEQSAGHSKEEIRADDDNKKSNENDNQNQVIQKEEQISGQVSLRVYWDYIVHIGVFPMLLTFLALVVNRVLYFSAEWWISAWASTDESDQRDHKWIWVLIGLTVAVIATVILPMFGLFSLLINGSSNLHKQMAKRVIHAPLVFFHRNPTGRILNRFSKDTGVQDDELPQNVGDVLILTLQAIGTMIIVSIALPYMIPVLITIVFLVRKLRNYYVVTSREIRRYDGTTRSPVYAMLSSNIKALPTIHAFEKEENFQAMFQRALDLNGSWWIAFLATSRWIAFRMDGFVSAVCALTVILSVALVDQVSKEVLGLALVYIVASSGTLQWWMRQTADLENRMTSIERNLEYTKLDQEPPRASEGGGNAPSNWPYNGTIEYSSVTAVYRPGLEPVLKQLQFVIPGRSSVGIVGRTGSGKSSLLLSLFRLIDINEGRIFIDSVDTSSIGIDVLRKQLAIIPQDPVLFGGSFRSNLDPWNEFSDAQVWTVLSRVHLEETVKAFGGINAPVAECGNNLSVGQRQLLCLARALLADSKILALDEATANVDRTTDAMIQDALHSTTVRNEKTLLIIAHRIDTVLDCDLILVLDSGRVAEFGSPVSLLSRENGLFKRMVDATKENAEIKGHEKGT